MAKMVRPRARDGYPTSPLTADAALSRTESPRISGKDSRGRAGATKLRPLEEQRISSCRAIASKDLCHWNCIAANQKPDFARPAARVIRIPSRRGRRPGLQPADLCSDLRSVHGARINSDIASLRNSIFARLDDCGQNTLDCRGGTLGLFSRALR